MPPFGKLNKFPKIRLDMFGKTNIIRRVRNPEQEGLETLGSIREWVAAYLERADKTKADLAHELGMSKTTFYSKMSGTTEFTLSEAGKLASMLGITTDQLLISPFDLIDTSAG